MMDTTRRLLARRKQIEWLWMISNCARKLVQTGSNFKLPLTDPHHMVIKPFLLLGLAAELNTDLDGGCDCRKGGRGPADS